MGKQRIQRVRRLHSGSGGGTRTPDTRIMIPTVSEEYQSLDCKQDEKSPQSNQMDSDGGVNEKPYSLLDRMARKPRDYHCFSCGGRAPTKGGHVTCPDWKPAKPSGPIWSPSDGHLYFIGSGDGAVKIGRSHNPKARLRSLQTSSPCKLELLAVAEECGGMELAYHARFAAHRLHGEWFAPHPDILAEIDRLNSRAGKRLASPPAHHSEKGLRNG